jgi:amidophosphoribosyltransferase
MFPCRFNLSTRSIHELAARKAIRDLEGHDVQDVSEYIDQNSEKYKRMIDWIAGDLSVTTLRYQTVDDMVKSIGLPKEKLCLYCWTGECPRACGRKTKIGIKEIKAPSVKKTQRETASQNKLW